MWSIFAVIVLTICIIIYEVPRLRKENQDKELKVFIVLMIVGVTLNILEYLNVSFPNPLDLITYIYKPFVGILE